MNSVSDMYTRFTRIITSLHSLGRQFSNAEKVNKILCCLPKSWDAKVTAISESKDLENYSVDLLLGSLIDPWLQGENVFMICLLLPRLRSSMSLNIIILC